MKRDLGEGYEVDDDPERIDVAAVHRYISKESYWAPGRAYEHQERLVLSSAPLRIQIDDQNFHERGVPERR